MGLDGPNSRWAEEYDTRLVLFHVLYRVDNIFVSKHSVSVVSANYLNPVNVGVYVGMG